MTNLALLAACLIFVSAPGAQAASALSSHERAAVIAARHLLSAIGSPALSAAVRDRSLRSDAYWRRVFAAAGEPGLYDEIAGDLRRAMDDVPLVGGRPAEPDVFARAVLRGIGPMPMKPLNEAPAVERAAILGFARKNLAAFSKAAYADPTSADEEGLWLAAEARKVFRSGAIADAFAQLGRLAGLTGDEARVSLVDTKDRLNEYLHPFGLHLAFDGNDLQAGRTNLASYVILSKHAFSILGKPFVVYEARPSVESHTTSALGHAEVEPGYMFIFANHVDKETQAGVAFSGGASLASLWRGTGGGDPMGGLPAEAVAAVEAAVRARVAAGTGRKAPAYRSLLLNTIGRHEGFHMYIEPAIAHAVRRGKISRSMSGTWHENGAYLYQLEVGDPRFVHMDLLMLLMVAVNGNAAFPDNTAGARAALADLQAYVKGVSFWDAAAHRAVPSGLAALFALEPADIQRAASQARWAFEVTVRN